MARSCRCCRISSQIRPCALPPPPARQTSLSDRKNIGVRDRALSRNLRPVPSATETPANTVAAHDPCYGATGLAIQHRAPRHEGEFPALLDKRSEEHTSELQSLMRISYAVFCLKKKKHNTIF